MKYYRKKLPHWQKWVKSTGMIWSLLAIMLTAGCASHPSASTVQSWPGSPPPGYAILMIYWTSGGWSEGGGAASVYVDDINTFKLPVNHYTWIYVKAGPHVLRTEWGFKTFGWNPEAGLNMKKEKNFEDGVSYYLKLRNWSERAYVDNDIHNVSWDHVHVTLNQVSEETARKEAGTCWFHKPSIRQIDKVSEPSDKSADEMIENSAGSVGSPNSH